MTLTSDTKFLNIMINSFIYTFDQKYILGYILDEFCIDLTDYRKEVIIIDDQIYYSVSMDPNIKVELQKINLDNQEIQNIVILKHYIHTNTI